MGDFLIQQWRLSVLRIQLDLSSSSEPGVDIQLVAYEGSQPHTLWQQHHPAADFGIPSTGLPRTLQLPNDLIQAINHSFNDQLNSETALWLRLVPPYGFLGAVPWEDELVPILNRPVLRVPDRLPTPAEFGTRWTAVVALAAPTHTDWRADNYIESFANALDTWVPGVLELHVFADAATSEALSPRSSTAINWLLHTAPTSPKTSWTDWIHAALGGRSARSLHVVTEAAFDGELPTLLLDSRPTHQSGPPRFVPVDAIVKLADNLGATTLSFGSPPDNWSALATRMLADGVGITRSGPTIFSDIDRDPHGELLARTYAYLAPDRPDVPIPFGGSLSVYLQPEYLQADLAEAWPQPEARTRSAGDEILPWMPAPDLPEEYIGSLVSRIGSTEVPQSRRGWSGVESVPSTRLADEREVPAWVASSEQYLTNCWSQLARTTSPAAESDEFHSAYQAGAAEALQQLDDLVRKHGDL